MGGEFMRGVARGGGDGGWVGGGGGKGGEVGEERLCQNGRARVGSQRALQALT